jgi:NAD(P)-dependent dehydrogenase (short-subunit alcohol dehydrogenase family)
MDLMHLFDVSGKVAIVTGGSRGIGEMIAEGLVTNGVRTYITARKAEACDATAARLSELGHCVSLPADLSSAEGVASFVERFGEHEDELHILANNAGAAWGASMGEFPELGFDKVLDINVKAPFMLTQALLGPLSNAATPDDPGRVIMTGSIDGIRVPVGDNFSYSASKAGIHMLARHMAKFLVDRNITVNCIAPGPFESKMMEYRLADPAVRKAIEDANPRGRIGTPEDVAGTVIWLSSRAGAFINGATIPVDGGIAMLNA